MSISEALQRMSISSLLSPSSTMLRISLYVTLVLYYTLPQVSNTARGVNSTLGRVST
jgi:hypothetical protein